MTHGCVRFSATINWYIDSRELHDVPPTAVIMLCNRPYCNHRNLNILRKAGKMKTSLIRADTSEGNFERLSNQTSDRLHIFKKIALECVCVRSPLWQPHHGRVLITISLKKKTKNVSPPSCAPVGRPFTCVRYVRPPQFACVRSRTDWNVNKEH